jgi:thiol-disulfide isomerase/thioredoxin
MRRLLAALGLADPLDTERLRSFPSVTGSVDVAPPALPTRLSMGLGVVGDGINQFRAGIRTVDSLITAAARAPVAGKDGGDLELTTLEGQSIRLESIHGRPLVINFFATWCDPCREEISRPECD